MKSIVGRLQLSIFITILGVLGLIGVVAARLTLQKVNEYCDARLIHAAVTMDQLMVLAPAGDQLARRPITNVPVLPPMGATRTYELEVGYRVLSLSGQDVLATENFRHLTGTAIPQAGFSDVHLDGRKWRLYRFDDINKDRIVIVGERHDSRRDILSAVWLEHTLPLLLGLPLLGWLATWSVERVLAPLSRLASHLVRRPAGTRDPIVMPGHGPELAPLIHAVNLYLLRVDHALDRETRLSADVAHELRTPIAPAVINVEGALNHAPASELTAALPEAIAGLQVLRERSEELLTLARLDEALFAPSGQVDLVLLIQGAITEARAEAAIRGVTLGQRTTPGHWWVTGDEAALHAMLRNLVANALRHAPQGGTVTVTLEASAGAPTLAVTDDGPGIPAERREAVFQRFQRDTGLGDGFGLGLSIVHRVVHLHGATVALGEGTHGKGLRVAVTFPENAASIKGAPRQGAAPAPGLPNRPRAG